MSASPQKKQALLATGTLNPHPETVQSVLFTGDFFDPDRNPTSQLVGSATIGGPILRDRLWYFASLLGSETETTRYLSILTERVKLAFREAGIRTPDQGYRDLDLYNRESPS